MGLSRRLRYEILRRDDHACRYCGGRAPDVPLTVDHVVPVALGGSDEPANLVTACADCNAGKSASAPDAPLVADITEDALRWAAAMKLASDVQFSDANDRARYVAEFDEAWVQWTYADGSTIRRPSDWRATVGRWHDAGLELDVLSPLVADVLPRPVADERMWRYLCGAVRNVLRQRVGIARQILDRDTA